VWSIVHKEYRQRARGVATVGLITTYTVILGVVAFFVYLGSYAALAASTKTSGDVGLAMSIAVFIAQMIMALLLSLSLNASTIAAERDGETLDLLNLTLFKSWEIVIGKYLSSTGFLFILVATALPVYALAFTFGGISLDAFWELAAVVVGMTLFVSSLGLLFSLTSVDVRTALSRSFLTLFALAFATFLMGGLLVSSLHSSPPNAVVYWLGAISMLLNPAWGATDVLSPVGIGGNLAWPAPLPAAVPFLVQHHLLWAWSAIAQTLVAAMIVAATSLAYPRYRAIKTGGVN
jgi:hypothetical protein